MSKLPILPTVVAKVASTPEKRKWNPYNYFPYLHHYDTIKNYTDWKLKIGNSEMLKNKFCNIAANNSYIFLPAYLLHLN